MRTNIELSDKLMVEARKHSSAQTKRALIEEALATFIAVQRERQQAASYSSRLHDIQGRLGNFELRESPRDLLRQNRK